VPGGHEDRDDREGDPPLRRPARRPRGPGGLLRGRAGGFALWRLLTSLGVACDIVAASLVPVRAGDRVKTDRRDAKKLVGLHRGGLLCYVCPPTPETEGRRDLLRCRDDLRRARTAAGHRVGKQLLRHGRVFRDGVKAWTLKHRAWVARQSLHDPLAQLALEQMLVHLDGIDRQLAALDAQLERIAGDARWAWQVERLRAFRGISTLTALGLIAGDRRLRALQPPARARRLAWITPSEYSSGDQQHRGHNTKAGNRHARRLLIEAAWHDRHPPRRPSTGPQPTDRAWHAQIRLHGRHRQLTERSKRSTVVTVAVARELAAFLWAELTDQPTREEALAA
jgi:transposase